LHGTFPVLGLPSAEAGYRLQISHMFAAPFLLSATGIVIYLVIAFLSRLLLRHWHESAIEDQEE
jgi:NitT/TauT family transport system permease protein